MNYLKKKFGSRKGSKNSLGTLHSDNGIHTSEGSETGKLEVQVQFLNSYIKQLVQENDNLRCKLENERNTARENKNMLDEYLSSLASNDSVIDKLQKSIKTLNNKLLEKEDRIAKLERELKGSSRNVINTEPNKISTQVVTPAHLVTTSGDSSTLQSETLLKLDSGTAKSKLTTFKNINHKPHELLSLKESDRDQESDEKGKKEENKKKVVQTHREKIINQVVVLKEELNNLLKEAGFVSGSQNVQLNEVFKEDPEGLQDLLDSIGKEEEILFLDKHNKVWQIVRRDDFNFEDVENENYTVGNTFRIKKDEVDDEEESKRVIISDGPFDSEI